MEDNFHRLRLRSANQLDGAVLSRILYATASWEEYVIGLASLPNIVHLMWKFSPITISQQNQCKKLEWYYETLARWFAQLMAPDESSDPDLDSYRNAKLEARAKLSKAVLNLSEQLFLRVPQIKTQTNKTPAVFWFKWEFQNFVEMTLHSGLMSGEPGAPESKELLENKCRTVANLLKSADQQTLSRGAINNDGENLDNFHALICFAYGEGAKDIRFRNSKEYVDFYKALLAWGRICRKDPDLQLSRFEHGEGLPGGRKASRSRSE